MANSSHISDLIPEGSTMEAIYSPQDAISELIKGTCVTGGAGLLMSAIQASLDKKNVGAFGAISKYGGTIGYFGRITMDIQCEEMVN
jgi:hypothetical protein